MGVIYPPGVSEMLALLGVPPLPDEDQIREDAAAWRTVLSRAEPAAGAAEERIRSIQQNYQGDSATALQAHWERVGNGTGHLAQATAAVRSAPVLLEGGAATVTAVKVLVGAWAAYSAVRMGRALLTGPLGAATAAAEMYLARRMVAKLLREGSEGTGKVLAPVLGRQVRDPLQRILDNLRRPGGGGPSPALAGAGGRNVPAAGRKDPFNGNGIALFGKKKKEPLNQENRNPHDSNARKSSKDKHENAARHGGRRNIPLNPNKRKNQNQNQNQNQNNNKKKK